jgi:peptidoglycan/LPS O-acetylase OafA/YrhL
VRRCAIRLLRAWARAELALLAGLSVLSIALQFLVLESAPRWVGGSVLGYAFWFALGMGMAVLSVRWNNDERKPAPIRWVGARPEMPWLLAFALYMLLCLWLPATTFLLARGDVFVAHVAFGIIALLLLAPAVFEDRSGGLPRRLIARPVVAWLGLVSYGIFLWHYVVTLELGTNGAGAPFLVVLLGTLAISISVAALSY